MENEKPTVKLDCGHLIPVDVLPFYCEECGVTLCEACRKKAESVTDDEILCKTCLDLWEQEDDDLEEWAESMEYEEGDEW